MSKYHIATYYFPNYHIDSRNEQWHGKGWTEWNLLRAATPRFEGHDQPKVPLWGYEDESDPAVMAKKIQAAADSGLEAFVFDWYWYDDGPYLQRALDKGFLNAPNTNQLKFAIMWANHDWVEIQPAIRADRPVRKHGAVHKITFEKATQHMIDNYFNKLNYWRVDGKLYFSIYELYKLVDGLGGLENTKTVLEEFRHRVRKAGLGELHINAIVWGIQILPGEKMIQNPQEMLTFLGIDSATSYVWIHYLPTDSFPVTSYAYLRELAQKANTELASRYSFPYFPNVTMGWDSSPRTIQTDMFDHLGYPYVPVLGENSPAEFEQALTDVRTFLDNTPRSLNTALINAWNEWTEGSYLEPDSKNSYGYLDAIKKVFQNS